MNTGICYTQSGSVKKYEKGLISFSPDRVKFAGIDNYFVKPFIPYMFTPSNHPPEVSLEEGTVMYVVGVCNIDDSSIDLSTYLSYTPPDGYELVSEDHKYDTGVKEYFVSKYFSITEPITLYYGTAGKTITDLGLNAGKDFYYKKKEIKDNKINVRLSVSHDIIINGNTYIPQKNKVIHTIDLKSGDGRFMDILVGLDSNHYTGSFNISFESVYESNIEIYLSVNRHLYKVSNLAESKRCYISGYNSFHNDGYMYTTTGFDYTFSSNAWSSNSLFTQRDTRDDFGESIPPETRMKYVVKFTLDNGDYRQDCQLDVDVTTNK